MSDTRESKIDSKRSGGQPPFRLLTPVPVPIPGDEGYRQRQFSRRQDSWWQSCVQSSVQWFRYYSIQFRWDIERGLARLFHRRWP